MEIFDDYCVSNEPKDVSAKYIFVRIFHDIPKTYTIRRVQHKHIFTLSLRFAAKDMNFTVVLLTFCTCLTLRKYTQTRVSWWRHQMETFSALLTLCARNSPVPVNSPHKGQWRGALRFSLICARMSDWVNNHEAGDLRRHRGHYDVVVM